VGLELVEIVMDVEETFGISLPDARVSEIRTAGELNECIVEILGQDLDETSVAQTVLDRLRNAISVGGQPDDCVLLLHRSSARGGPPSGTACKQAVAHDVSINADTRLSTLFPRFGRKRDWKRLEESLDLPLPPLVRPRLLNTIAIVVAIPLGWICGLSAILALDLPKAGFLAALAAILGLVLGLLAIVAFWLVGRWLTSPLAASWPKGLCTVGDLSQAILQMHYGRVVRREHGFSRDEVWCILQEIVAGVLGIDRERITPEARFAEDLGAG